MNTKNIKQFCTLLLLVVCNSVSAYDFSAENEGVTIKYNIISETEVEVTYDDLNLGTRYEGDIIIPASVSYNGNTMTVTAIGDQAFEFCADLASIVIPNTVTSIGIRAFNYCVQLKSFTIPNSVSEIGASAFAYCPALTSIQIPTSVQKIGTTAFYGCYFTHENFVNLSEESDFQDWGIIFIDDETAEGLLIKDNTVIGHRSDLTSAIIPSGVTTIGDFAFEGCTDLASVTIPNTVTTIGDGAFQDCTSLTSISIPEGVTSIGEATFANCSALTSIVLPEGVTTIGNYAFIECFSLKSVVIPSSVTSIGELIFFNCEFPVTNFINNSGLTDANNWGATIYDNTTDGLVIVDNKVVGYRPGLTSAIIPSSVTAIGEQAFYGCSTLESVEIPNSVTSIGENAFYGCYFTTANFVNNSGLTDAKNWGAIIYDELTADGLYIKGNTVVGCRPDITAAVIPDGITAIAIGAFSNCSTLESINIPKSVTAIGEEAFSGCTSLAVIAIPSSVVSIGTNVFDGCSNLKYIYSENPVPPTVYSGLSSDPDFYDSCTLYVPNGLENIYSHAAVWGSFTTINVYNPATPVVKSGDVNKDGVVDAQDASLIQQYVAGKITW